MISKKGIFGIKWSWLILGALGYLFRKELKQFLQPMLDKLKTITNSNTLQTAPSVEDKTTDI